MNIQIYNPNTEEEKTIQEDVFGLSMHEIGKLIAEKYPDFLVKDIWQ